MYHHSFKLTFNDSVLYNEQMIRNLLKASGIDVRVEKFEESEEVELARLLDCMDVPELRLDISKIDNVRWLLRNLEINNSHHFNLSRARTLLILVYQSLENKRFEKKL